MVHYITQAERDLAASAPGYKVADFSSYPSLGGEVLADVQPIIEPIHELTQAESHLGAQAVNGPANAAGEISG